MRVQDVFESATRFALQELIQRHGQETRYGYLLTQETAQNLVTDLFELFQTSRNLQLGAQKFRQNSSSPLTASAPATSYDKK